MPNFRFETTAAGQTIVTEESLAHADLASPRAIELAKAATAAAAADADHAGSNIRVYDDAGYLIATVSFSDVLEPGASSSPRNLPPEEPGVMRSG